MNSLISKFTWKCDSLSQAKQEKFPSLHCPFLLHPKLQQNHHFWEVSIRKMKNWWCSFSLLRSGVLQMAVAIHLSIAFSNKFETLQWPACILIILNGTLYLDLLLVAGSYPFKDKISLLLYCMLYLQCVGIIYNIYRRSQER